MSWGMIGAAVVGGVAAKSAADSSAGAMNKATSIEQQRVDEENRRYQEMQPFRTAQLGAVGQISDIESGRTDAGTALRQDPGYQFRLGQGQTALDRFMSARGYRLGGRGLKEGIRYNQDFASQEFGNMMNRKYRLAGLNAPQPTPVPQNQLGALAIGQGQNQANLAANLNQVAQQGIGNYQTYRTYNDWMKNYNNQMAGAPYQGGVPWSSGYGGE